MIQNAQIDQASYRLEDLILITCKRKALFWYFSPRYIFLIKISNLKILRLNIDSQFE